MEIHSVGFRNTPDEFNAVLLPLNSPKQEDLFYMDWPRDCESRNNYQITPVCKKIVQIFEQSSNQFATDWFNTYHKC